MLTDAAARQAKAKEKDYKLSDGNGLFLLVKTNGSKYWRLKYRYLGAEKSLALGVYPDVKMVEARRRATEAREHDRFDRIAIDQLRRIHIRLRTIARSRITPIKIIIKLCLPFICMTNVV